MSTQHPEDEKSLIQNIHPQNLPKASIEKVTPEAVMLAELSKVSLSLDVFNPCTYNEAIKGWVCVWQPPASNIDVTFTLQNNSSIEITSGRIECYIGNTKLFAPGNKNQITNFAPNAKIHDTITFHATQFPPGLQKLRLTCELVTTAPVFNPNTSRIETQEKFTIVTEDDHPIISGDQMTVDDALLDYVFGIAVQRDSQGIMVSAQRTGDDGVIHHFTVIERNFTNQGGFPFITSQANFFENEQEYLSLTTIASPYAGKWSFQASSGISRFGYVASISPQQGKGTLVTNTGQRVIVDLTNTSLLSPKILVPLTFPPAIQQALNNTLYFRPLFELESARSRTNAEEVLKSVNLDPNMPANVVIDAVWEKSIPLLEGKVWWQLAGVIIFAVIGGVIVSIVGEGMEIGAISAFEASSYRAFGGGLLAAAAYVWKALVDMLPDNPPIPQGDDSPPQEDDAFPSDMSIQNWSEVPDANGGESGGGSSNDPPVSSGE